MASKADIYGFEAASKHLKKLNEKNAQDLSEASFGIYNNVEGKQNGPFSNSGKRRNYIVITRYRDLFVLININDLNKWQHQ